MAKTIKITCQASQFIKIERTADGGGTYTVEAIISKWGIADVSVVPPITNPQKGEAQGFTGQAAGNEFEDTHEIHIRMNSGHTHKIILKNVISPADWSANGGNTADLANAIGDIETVLDFN